jgi:hypothetical protein
MDGTANRNNPNKTVKRQRRTPLGTSNEITDQKDPAAAMALFLLPRIDAAPAAILVV